MKSIVIVAEKFDTSSFILFSKLHINIRNNFLTQYLWYDLLNFIIL